MQKKVSEPNTPRQTKIRSNIPIRRRQTILQIRGINLSLSLNPGDSILGVFLTEKETETGGVWICNAAPPLCPNCSEPKLDDLRPREDPFIVSMMM